jgi:hypothetical protein
VDPHLGGKGARRDDVTTWWYNLEALETAPRRHAHLVPTTLVVAAVVLVAAMPLSWHHEHIPGGSYTVVNGLSSTSWLLLVAALAVVLAIWTYLSARGLGIQWSVTVLAFATVNGMFFDYFDWSTRGVSLYVAAHYGPGFFVGLGGAALTVAAAILAWRLPE